MPRAKIDELIESVLDSRDKQNFMNYAAFPGDKNNVYNCLTWAIDQLVQIGVLKEEKSKTWRDAIPSEYVPHDKNCFVM